MTTIPGAEYAPIIAIIGGRYQQPSEGAEQQFRSAEAVLHGTTLKTMGGHVRRLSYSDPDDMRAIWRRAAIAHGATEEEAMDALLSRHWPDDHRRRDRKWWRLGAPGRWFCEVEGVDREYATAALCAHVWGPI